MKLPLHYPSQLHKLLYRTTATKIASRFYSRSTITPIRAFSTSQFLSRNQDLNMAPKEKAVKEKGKGMLNLKVPKGTKDWEGKDMIIRDKIFGTITDVFKRHGAVTIDTPVFELREVLTGKYGEDSKLIYDLADQGGEICSLRYDLTVPFARWLAMNPSIQSIKRYHIAKVYRRDQPAMTKGRMREFYQCDFDIAGVYDPMLPDAEILRITTEILDGLNLGTYTIKINHRQILDGLFQICGVPTDKIRTISSAVDKLDKSPWEEVRKEMVDEKGLDPAVADKIGEYVLKKGGRNLLVELLKDETLTSNESFAAGLKDMGLLFDYLEIFNVMPKLSFDLSLARGLDYYTGIIYEVVTEASAPPAKGHKSKKPVKAVDPNDPDADRSNDDSIGVGSIAAGGRYDELVGMFANSAKGRVPCVGISFGVDRIFSITKAKMLAEVRANEVDVFVMAFGGKGFTGLVKERMEVCRMLWDAGVKAEFSYKVKPKLPQQFAAADKNGVPFAIVLGEDEMKEGKVKIKEMGLPEGHPDKNGVDVELVNLVHEIKKRIATKKELESDKVSVLADDVAKVVLDGEKPTAV
ncbi:uncharacterized protein LAJ45_04818 [Morchella importuna]|uniref:uncharacterized protein n=1 Tax=Morchella importuna TaxID=1174673 RepID=UPI001E8EF16F|nr:uncharacterized protein LAJ45_04818 [Morchella importuna]KAH8151116.1 hypothetical protein LAJ45_04818 [Morchella importuna]